MVLCCSKVLMCAVVVLLAFARRVSMYQAQIQRDVKLKNKSLPKQAFSIAEVTITLASFRIFRYEVDIAFDLNAARIACGRLWSYLKQVNMAIQGFRHRHAELALSFLCFLWKPLHFVHIHPSASNGRVPRRAADFESGLSLEDMLQLVEERAKNAKMGTTKTSKTSKAKSPDAAPVPSVPLVAVPGNPEMELDEATDETDETRETPVLIPEVLNRIPSFGRQRLEAAVLPCVFSPVEQGERPIGVEVELRFWEPAYQLLWQYAQKRTAGAVAVRFSKGSLRRSPDVFALWPAEMKDGLHPSATPAPHPSSDS